MCSSAPAALASIVEQPSGDGKRHNDVAKMPLPTGLQCLTWAALWQLSLFSLFSLFCQENNSDRHLVSRGNPGVTMVRRAKEQQNFRSSFAVFRTQK
jgi:hypothetical protein